MNKHLLVVAASCAMVGSAVIGCAASPPYNPDNLDAARFDWVSGICRDVMGLSPSERLSGGNWLGNDRLDYWTSYYRGCIVSLSDSLQRAADVQVARQADEDCRAKGYKSDSPDLALCVLQSVNSHPDPSPSQTSSAALTPVSEKAPTASGSYFYASPHETVRREKLACAALGLEPYRGAFESCVKDLDNTFYAIDHPEN